MREGQQRRPNTFQRKELLLHAEPAAEPGQAAVRPDHAMTGNDNGNRVLTVGGADGTHGRRTSDVPRQLRITPRRTVRNLFERVPDVALKRGTGRRDRQIELPSLAQEVSAS